VTGRTETLRVAGVVAFHLVLEPLVAPVWAALVVVGLAAAILVIARLWWPAALARGRRAALMALRLAVVAAVGLMFLRPILVWQDREETPGQVAVLVDASRSMAICDVALDEARQGGAPAPATEGTAAAGPLSRTDAVRVAFLTAGKPYADLGRRCIINPYAFGTHVRPIGEFGPDPADPRTDITEALGRLVEDADERAAARREPLGRATNEPVARSAGDGPLGAEAPAAPPPLVAVILISDGRANSGRGAPEDVARQLADRGVPVHTVLAGGAEPSGRVRDVAVRDLRAPARIFMGNRPPVRAVVATVGMAGRTVDAVLSVDGKEVERRRVAPASNQTAQELVFSPRLDKVGLTRIAVAVEPVAGELLAANNRAETAVRVEEGDVRVLYLDGRIHPENKYVTRVLGEAKEIELDRRILIGSAASAATPAPADLDAYQVVILGDLPASALPAPLIARMAERVRAGNLGVLSSGGLSALGAGGWADTPLAAVLPVAIRAGDGQVAGPIHFRPTADGLRHFIFGSETGAGSPGAPRFDALPPLSGASVVGPLDPTAHLLAESDDGRTLLAVREFGRGRAAVLAVDTTWQWVLAPGETRGAEIHRRLWRQLVLWLAGRDERPQADLSIATDRPRYMLTDPDNPPEIEVTVHVRESAGAAAPTVTLTRRDGAGRAIKVAPKGSTLREPQGLTAAGGRWWQTVLTLREGGIYTLAAEAETSGAARSPQATQAARERAETQFVLEEQDFEWANILADRATMERIAEAGHTARMGGGTCRPIGELSTLLADLAAGIQPQVTSVERRLLPASGRMFLAAVLALLAAEWLLRRKWLPA